ncbi:MAG TPA: stage II sporulation protein P [Firmicutes bacterium]|nr:stage II sporulation protein P [Bacillota bacterium]
MKMSTTAKHSLRIRHSFLLCISLLVLILLSQPVALAEMERRDGFFTIVDEKGNELFKTAHLLSVGDIFINEDNKSYTLSEIKGDTAKAKFIEVVNLGVLPPKDARKAMTIDEWLLAQVRPKPLIGLYCTHSDESYNPTSGTSSKDWGDIYQVKASLADALRTKGFTVISSDANHNPHDGAAYERSRRTAAQLLKRRPAALIDVHRDAVPPEVYSTTVSGIPTTKVTLIVGRENQARGANLRFAKALKAAADRDHPGLVKGILVADGNYNQDLSGRSILLEFGANTNGLERAMESARLFADAIPAALSAVPESRPGMASGGTGRAVAWIIGIVLAVGLLLFVLSGGSWEGLKRQARRVVSLEFLNLLGIRHNKK